MSEYAPGISRNRAIIIFATVSLALLMSSIDLTIVSVSIPAILADLNTNLAYVSWVITGYQLSSTTVMPIVGKLSDDLGRKRLFLFCVAVFTLSSLAAGLSPNIYLLIIFRIFQGLGGGAFLPSATGIISDVFRKRRSTAIGLFASIFPIGGIIGPNVGGFLVDNLSWRWIFFVNIPIGIILLLVGKWVFPKDNVPAHATQRQVDFVGAGLFAGAVLAILYAMTNWANYPQNIGYTTWVLFAVGAVLLILFFRQESRVQQPMIDLVLLKWRPFLAANIYNFLYGAVVFGIFAYLPYYAYVAFGMSASQSGLILTPRSIGSIIMAAIASFFIIRFRYRLPMILGALIMSISFFILGRGYNEITIFGWQITSFWWLIIIATLSGIGMGITNPAVNNAVLDLLPEKVAAVTGIRGMFRVTGGVFGTAVIALVLSHFQDKALGLERISLLFGIILIAMIPLTFLIPDTAHQRRKQNRP